MSLANTASRFDLGPYYRANAADGRGASSILSGNEGALLWFFQPQGSESVYLIRTQSPFATDQIQRAVGAGVDGRFGDGTRMALIRAMRADGETVPDTEPAVGRMIAYALRKAFHAGRGTVALPPRFVFPDISRAPRATGRSTLVGAIDTSTGRAVSLEVANAPVQRAPTRPADTQNQNYVPPQQPGTGTNTVNAPSTTTSSTTNYNFYGVPIPGQPGTGTGTQSFVPGTGQPQLPIQPGAPGSQYAPSGTGSLEVRGARPSERVTLFREGGPAVPTQSYVPPNLANLFGPGAISFSPPQGPPAALQAPSVQYAPLAPFRCPQGFTQGPRDCKPDGTIAGLAEFLIPTNVAAVEVRGIPRGETATLFRSTPRVPTPPSPSPGQPAASDPNYWSEIVSLVAATEVGGVVSFDNIPVVGSLFVRLGNGVQVNADLRVGQRSILSLAGAFAPAGTIAVMPLTPVAERTADASGTAVFENLQPGPYTAIAGTFSLTNGGTQATRDGATAWAEVRAGERAIATLGTGSGTDLDRALVSEQLPAGLTANDLDRAAIANPAFRTNQSGYLRALAWVGAGTAVVGGVALAASAVKSSRAKSE